MKSLIYDRDARSILVQQQKRIGIEPLRWHGLIDGLDKEFGGVGAAEGNLASVLVGRRRLFAWQPSLEAVAASAIPGALVYLCWGVPHYSRLRSEAFGRIIRGASSLLVNDSTTLQELETRYGRRADVIRFFIDTEYFRIGTGQRERFVFCNGSNDRDPALLLSLAERGVDIVWLVNDIAIRKRYEGVTPRLKIVSRISYDELRTLYQSCALCIMPALRDVHCAGQTTGMEALSSGASLVISSGRTASLFEGLPNVEVMPGTDVDAWCAAIERAIYAFNPTDALLSREEIVRRCDRGNITRELAPHLGWSVSSESKGSRLND